MAAATTWGDPTSDKRVFLIHGGATSSHSWNRIAQAFASRGYFVTAPDLLGHGLARRGSVYTVAALAEDLWPYLKSPGGDDHPYDIVIGHSLGGIVASALLPLLKSTRPVRVILGDPPLEQSPEVMAMIISGLANLLRNPEPVEAIVEKQKIATEDAMLVHLGRQLCDVAAMEAMGKQNVPWSFSHYLETVPDNVNVTVLVADPSKGPLRLFKEEDVKDCPRVTTRIVWGTSHWMQFERPEAFVEAALE